MKHLAWLTAIFLVLAAQVGARPVQYVLDAGRSQVGFSVGFGKDEITGTIPIQTAEVELDFERQASSLIHVVLDTTRARASFPFATQAMVGPKVLDVAHYPTITFTSRSLSIGATSARISGDLTIRGVTRPVSLEAQVFRQRGTEAGDRSKLSVHVTGRVRRSEFGATGWSDMVGDEIMLNILVRIDRAEG